MRSKTLVSSKWCIRFWKEDFINLLRVQINRAEFTNPSKSKVTVWN